MTEPPEPLTVNRHPQLSRYEARRGTVLVTVIDFTLSGSTVVITHTRTDPQWRGRGYAGQATAAMLDDLRTTGEKVRPRCPFTVDFMAAHPEYDDLRAWVRCPPGQRWRASADPTAAAPAPPAG